MKKTSMKPYKKALLKGFEERNFELIELSDIITLPWWIEEKWILSELLSNKLIIVNFLTDKNWESGIKIVDEVLITSSEMENYSDNNSKIIGIDMRKGNFAEKLKIFWLEFEKTYKLN